LKQKRYRIETVIGQLVKRFNTNKVKARDIWHPISRWFRKVLSHTMAVFHCQTSGLSSLKIAKLLIE
jgi:hypothetical protein